MSLAKNSKKLLLNYVELGAKNAAHVVVFMSGWPDHSQNVYAEQIRALTTPQSQSQFRLLVVDIPGYELPSSQHQESSLPFWGFTVQEVAEALHNTLEDYFSKTKKEKLSIVSHDWGVAITAEFNYRYPNYIDKYVALDIGIGGAGNTHTFAQVLMVLAYQWTLASLFLWSRVLPTFLMDAVTRGVCKLMTAPDAANATCYMNNLYLRIWLQIALPFLFGPPPQAMAAKRDYSNKTGRGPFPEYERTPILFLFADSKPFFFHEKRFLDFLGAKGAVDGASKAVAIKSKDHWFAARRHAEEANHEILAFLKK